MMCEHEKIAGGTWVGWESHMIIVRQLAAANSELKALKSENELLRHKAAGHDTAMLQSELTAANATTYAWYLRYEALFTAGDEMTDDADNEIELLQSDLAAANARVAELETGKRLAWEKAQKYRESTDRFAKAYIDKLNDWQDAIDREAKAEVQCDELKKANSELASAAIEIPPYKATLLEENRRMREALEEIIARCELRRQDDDAHCENYYEAKQALKGTDNGEKD